MFAGWIVISTGAAAIDLSLPHSAAGRGIAVLLGLGLPWIALIGWPWYFARRFGAGPAREFGWAIRWSDVWLGIVGGLAALVLAGVVASITSHFLGKFSSAAGEVAGTLHGQRVWLTFFALLVAFGAPIAEELAFRGVLFAALLRRGIAPALTNVIVAIVFALFHFEPIRIPLLVGIGLVLGYLRQRTGRVGASVVAHSLNNAIGAWSLLSM